MLISILVLQGRSRQQGPQDPLWLRAYFPDGKNTGKFNYKHKIPGIISNSIKYVTARIALKRQISRLHLVCGRMLF